MDDFERELKQGFLDEAEQSISDVEQSFLSLETDPHNNEHINQIFRLAHNLKGSSKAVGFEQFGQFTHQFESFVLRIKNNDLKANSTVVSLLLKTTAFIKLMIYGLRNNIEASFDVETILNEMKNFSQTNAPAAPVVNENKNANHDESIRVALSKFTKEIQNLSVGLRMVSIKTTFQKMQRIVRTTAQQLNKDVNVTLLGEETELDKSVLENINDPLAHLIRNSVDHGIENTEIREANGKPSQGNVILKAFHHSGRLVLEVIDDGCGLDAKKLKNLAVQKGILNKSDILSDSESYKLIFVPGFSTKTEVTEVSGRGVGMDVVKTNIEKLGGEIQIQSFLGKGTTMRITLPVTVAMVDGLVNTYNNQKYIIRPSHV